MELQNLADRAVTAKETALALYSGFPVGAALLTESGKIYTGCNIESSSFGLTMCAERVALYKALSEGERSFKAIAIAANVDNYCPPCGACRQVLWDFAKDVMVVLVNSIGAQETHQLSELLPHAFDDGVLSNG